MTDTLSTLEGWGRHPTVQARQRQGSDIERLTDGVELSRGLGRSYGDASLPVAGALVANTRFADRIIAFDDESGVLHAEAGLSLHDLTWTYLPRGWCSPVMPGTAYITLGGMVAADVHAKNHHVEGTIGRWVERLRLRLASGDIVWTDRETEPDLFRATLGGMGLTGHVLEVVLRLQRVPSSWIWAETERVDDLETYLASLRDAAGSWPLTMGWIDCLKRGSAMGRGILYRGRWATGGEVPGKEPTPQRRLTVPIDLPSLLLNRGTVGLFNAALFAKHRAGTRRGTFHLEDFFHPLDKVLHWNRGYGKAGFTQYQCVVPARHGAAGVRRMMEVLTRSGAASFLCVIKDCGEEGEGVLSFPMPGTSIAVDLPVRPGTSTLVARLNRCLIELGGRVYLAKDTFTTAADYRAMDGERIDRFLAIRQRYDPHQRLRSLQSVRLFGDRPPESLDG